eukprot:4402049-Alexandrium_andersonii.AAC.1
MVADSHLQPFDPDVYDEGPEDEADEPLEDEAAGEQPQARELRQPLEPDARARAIHEMTHVPYAEWRETCVRPRGPAPEHRGAEPRRHPVRLRLLHGPVGARRGPATPHACHRAHGLRRR